MDPVTIGVLVFFAVFILILLAGSFFMVDQQTTRIVERFGKFKKVANAGLNFKWPIIEGALQQIDMRLQQITVTVDTKTKDNVFVSLDVAVQYEIMTDKVYEAYYRLQEPVKQITSYVFDVVRAKVPTLPLDDVFTSKDEIAGKVNDELKASMEVFGFSIEKTLVVDIRPDEKVQAAMNDINAAQREQEAATARGEAQKIITVKQAEADAEAKALAGKGIADERKAIVGGLRESISDTATALGIDPKEVMMLVMATQYFDTLREIGKTGTTIMLPSGAGGAEGIANEIRNAIISGSSAVAK